MAMTVNASNGRPLHASQKRSFKMLLHRTRPDLAVDTSFTHHHGQAPQQVFPYESRTQERSFVGLDRVTALRNDKDAGLKPQLENGLAIRPGARRAVSENTLPGASDASSASRPTMRRSRTASIVPTVSDEDRGAQPRAQPLHKRIRGLRPSPLDLTQDVSPSDRAITIDIAVPSASLSQSTAPASGPSTAPRSQSPRPTRRSQHYGQQVFTPTIVLTPAKEDFDLSLSLDDLQNANGYRPASSVYSRYTNCMPKPSVHDSTPPVPPFPLFTEDQCGHRDDLVQQQPAHRAGVRANTLSICTVFEEDDAPSRQSRRLTAQAHLPTPRRSRGWWNVITSPFSATSAAISGTHFWRSPSGHGPPSDTDEKRAILDDASEMGYTDSRTGLVFTTHATDDEELRSAILPDTRTIRPRVPKRSDTAPGALDTSADGVVNIYRIPSQGLAAPYYEIGRSFPSLVSESLSRNVDGLEGWSPSDSVFRPEGVDANGVAGLGLDEHNHKPRELKHEHETAVCDDKAGEVQGVHREGSFAHERISRSPPTATKRVLFSTPSEDELREANPPRPANDRSNTAATFESVFSPLTATPIVEEAHVATFVGPQSANGELREVELTPVRSLTPPFAMPRPETAKAPGERMRNSHTRSPPIQLARLSSASSSSRGLGISDGGENEKAFFPAPKHLRQQPRLGTDRFGQLIIRTAEDERPVMPWCRRFLWPLATASASLVVLLIVLLVMLIPQKSDDMPVQSQWLNLTGFPPLPTGVSTMVSSPAKEVASCVSLPSLWGCAVDSGEPIAPNFRFELRFRNGTLPRNETTIANCSSSGAAQAGALVRRSGSGSIFVANPSPPSKSDQSFIGQTTDNTTVPFEGVETPFYLSVLDPAPLEISALRKRQSPVYPYPTTADGSGQDSNASASAPVSVPRPAMRGNGEPALAESYPFVQAQPLRLFNRGRDDEHYGLYSYFDRSIYVANTSSASRVPLENATEVCTWAQTRFHVQIWTRKPVAASRPLLPSPGLAAANSSANDLDGAGSFPYAVTVTLDRHGGDARAKGLYCYGLDGQKHVVQSSGRWMSEDRGFGGRLIDPAAVPRVGNGSSQSVTKRDGNGGVDGGTGGCSCAWQNWAQ